METKKEGYGKVETWDSSSILINMFLKNKTTVFKEQNKLVFMQQVLCPGGSGIWKCLFFWRKEIKTREPGEKTLGARTAPGWSQAQTT